VLSVPFVRLGPQAIKIGRFRTSGELQYYDEIRGPLLLQVDRATDLLLSKYLPANVAFEGLQRVERYPVPEAAFRHRRQTEFSSTA
jgi:ATP-dependent DNA helicase RecG